MGRSSIGEAGRGSMSARRPRAFTLIELIVVIGLITLLVGLLVTAVSAVAARADRTRTRATLELLDGAVAASAAR